MYRALAAIVAVVSFAIAFGIWWQPGSDGAGGPALSTSSDTDEIVSVNIPETLSPNAQMGQRAFEAKCATCHGLNASGREGKGPPLVHKYYEPGHHADFAFERAVSSGVRSHHWNFGDMPPVEGLTRAEVQTIADYVRALQKENGIW